MGILSSLGVMLWIGIGTQVAKAHGFLKLTHKPYSTEGCRVLNETLDATLADLGKWVSATMATSQAQM